MTLRARLLAIAGPPLVVLLVASALALSRDVRQLPRLEASRTLAMLAVRATAVAHDAAKERGMSSGFLGSRGAKFGEEVRKQRGELDRRLAELTTALAAHPLPDEAAQRAAESALAAAERLREMRARVDALAVPAKEAFAYYTSLIADVLLVVEGVARTGHDARAVRLGTAYVAFARAKELAGSERGSLNNVFAADAFDAEHYRRVIGILADQERQLTTFLAYATPAARDAHAERLSPSSFQDAAAMRARALERASTGGFEIDPTRWWDAMTRKIAAMKEVEDLLSAEILAHLDAGVRDARRGLFINLLGVCAGVVIAVGIALLNARTILRQIGGEPSSVAAVARRIAGGDLSPIGGETPPPGSVLQAASDMLAALRDIAARAQATGVELERAAQTFSESSRAVRDGASTQASRLTETSGGVAQLSAALREISESYESMARTASRNAEAAERGSAAIEAASQEFERVRLAAVQTEQTIAALAAAYARVGDIVEHMDGLAVATHILSVNAGLEATRGRETAKGFGVVAEEMRNLAQRSAESVREVRAIVGGAGGQLAAVQREARLGASAVEDWSRNKAVLSEAFGTIESTAHDTRDAVAAVAAAVRDNVEVTRLANTAMDEVASLARESQAAAGATAEHAGRLHDSAAALRGVLSRFRLGEAPPA
jgi:methyl-accepting chemotaxis protein